MGEFMKKIQIFTDGACSGNPGPGGYGVILKYGKKKKELSQGYKNTTNNRMELMAIIAGLSALKEPCQVELYTDSQYIVNAINKGWAERWQKNGWKRNKKETAKNPDLWQQILDLLQKHKVTFHWVRGHAGHPENERCDQLAVQASAGRHLEDDKNYKF